MLSGIRSWVWGLPMTTGSRCLGAAAAFVMLAAVGAAAAGPEPAPSLEEALKAVPVPPPVEPPTEPAMLRTTPDGALDKRRAALLALVNRTAKQHGLPPAIADAVV